MESYGQMFEIQGNIFYLDTYAHGMSGAIGVLICRSGGGSVVFDSGMPNSKNNILKSIERLGVKPESVTHILLTHRHIDHAGGASFLLDEFPKASIGIHPFSASALSNPTKIYDGGRELFGEYATPMKPIQTSKMRTLGDREEINVGQEAVQAIYTPGHTSDHIAYYIHSSKILYCGDVVGSFNALRGCVHPTCMYPSFNYEKYKITIRQIRAMDLEGLVFPHFGYVLGRRNVRDVLEKSLSAHMRLGRIYEENISKPDPSKLLNELKTALIEATEIFPGPVREKAAELMARGFIEGFACGR
ncbi:MBL fold metallo-hydrolase [Candidatus Bathyarchaeota archaeon]|nr:MBL fold metallo-hydrolase [Candidatus Bathyarchaeota archaeon]